MKKNSFKSTYENNINTPSNSITKKISINNIKIKNNKSDLNLNNEESEKLNIVKINTNNNNNNNKKYVGNNNNININFEINKALEYTKLIDPSNNIILCTICNRKFNKDLVKGHLKWEYYKGNLKNVLLKEQEDYSNKLGGNNKEYFYNNNDSTII